MKSLLLLAVILSASVYARNQYGNAGCGLGSLVFGKFENQIFAATTNATGSQLFGITSGTSQCEVAHNRVENEFNLFAEVNWAQLRNDIARGQGEHLEAAGRLLGCPTNLPTNHKISRVLQSTLSATSNPADWASQSLNLLKAEPSLKGKCLF